MVKYSKKFKEQALLLSDERGVKQAAAHLRINYYAIAEWRKAICQNAKEARIASEQNCIEPARACHAARNTGTEKSKVKLHSQIMLPQLNVKFPHRQRAYLQVRLSAHELNRFQSLHAVQLLDFKEQNTQGCPLFFCRRPEAVSTQRLFSCILENAKVSVRLVVRGCLKSRRYGIVKE